MTTQWIAILGMEVLLLGVGCLSKSSVDLPAVDGVPLRVKNIEGNWSLNRLTGSNQLRFPGHKEGDVNILELRFTVDVTASIPEERGLWVKTRCALKGKTWAYVKQASIQLEPKTRFVSISALAKGASGRGLSTSPASVAGFGKVETCEFSLWYVESIGQPTASLPASGLSVGTVCLEPKGDKVTARTGACRPGLLPLTPPSDSSAAMPVSFSKPTVSFQQRGVAYWYWATAHQPVSPDLVVRNALRCGAERYPNWQHFPMPSHNLAQLSPGESILVAGATTIKRGSACEFQRGLGQATEVGFRMTDETVHCFLEPLVEQGACKQPPSAQAPASP